MDWGKWTDGLWRDLAVAGLPVLVGAVSAVRDNPEAPVWAAVIATAAVVALKRLFNWTKHKNDPQPVR